MAHGLSRLGEGRILPRARRHPFGVGGSGGGGDPGGGFSPPPSNDWVVIEGFEDQDISDYTGDNSLITDWTIESADPFEGSYYLGQRADVAVKMYKTDPVVQRTDMILCRFRNPADTPTLFTWIGLMFGVQDVLNYYLALVKYEGPHVVLEKYVGGEKTGLAEVEITWVPEIWKRLEVLWGSAGDIEVRFAGVNCEQTDTTFEDGGWGWWAQSGEGDPVSACDYLRHAVNYVE